MYIAVPLLFLLIFCGYLVLLATGIIAVSGVKPKVPVKSPTKSPVKDYSKQPVQPEVWKAPEPVKKAYIDLNGRLIELNSKKEETTMKKQGFKIVYK